MAVKITNPESQPALEYDEIFMDYLKIEQAGQTDNTQPPKFTLTIGYRKFATDVDNVRHFKQARNEIRIDDYYAVAMAKAMQGDMDLANAMAAIETALASIIADQDNSIEGVEVV